MEPDILSHLFRKLFQHRPRPQLRSLARLQHPGRPAITGAARCRPISASSHSSQTPNKQHRWQQRMDNYPENRSAEFEQYPMVTAANLRHRRERPRRVKMLARDFMEDSLYNPHYGYFSSQVVIFRPPSYVDFPSLKNEDAFRRQLSRQYSAFEDALDAKLDQPSKTRQLWHTPTELFAPHYGDAIARYLLANYKLTLYPYHDLIIHEVGAGNGTLMRNILDYIKDTDPEAYARTRYRIIEISSRMSARQQQHLASEHAAHIQLINKSIFDWDTYVPEPNYFLALEVADNFPHDLVRYAPGSSGDPLQAIVLIDGAGDFFEFYTPQLDPLAASFLRLRTATAERHARRHPRAGPLFPDARSPPLLTRFSRALSPFAPQLSDAEYLPTHLHRFFAILHHAFPSHRLLLGDFSSLPNAVPGINAPVVQTRFERRVVPVRTPFVHQGFFDILFPTNFELAEAMYRARTGKLTRVLPQSEFLERWARVGDARTGDGECPMLSWYQNAKVLMTV